MKIEFEPKKVAIYALAVIGGLYLLNWVYELAQAALVLYMCAHHGGC